MKTYSLEQERDRTQTAEIEALRRRVHVLQDALRLLCAEQGITRIEHQGAVLMEGRRP